MNERLIKEEKFWIIRGTLEQLNQLQKNGYKLKQIEKEPRPAEVVAIVPAFEDIQKVSEIIRFHSQGTAAMERRPGAAADDVGRQSNFRPRKPSHRGFETLERPGHRPISTPST